MENATSVLLDLPGFRVVEVRRVEDDESAREDRRLVVVETVEPVAACPECGVVAARVHERPLVWVKDLPVGSGRLRLVWRKRRYRCDEPLCARWSFTTQREALLRALHVCAGLTTSRHRRCRGAAGAASACSRLTGALLLRAWLDATTGADCLDPGG